MEKQDQNFSDKTMCFGKPLISNLRHSIDKYLDEKDMSIRELSERYGMTQRQIKYLLSKARNRLKTYLKKGGVAL